jgi:hypothetical protein
MAAGARSVPGTEGFESPEISGGDVNTCLTDAFSVGKLLLNVIQWLYNPPSKILDIANGLSTPEKEKRMSLEIALEEVTRVGKVLSKRQRKRTEKNGWAFES